MRMTVFQGSTGGLLSVRPGPGGKGMLSNARVTAQVGSPGGPRVHGSMAGPGGEHDLSARSTVWK